MKEGRQRGGGGAASKEWRFQLAKEGGKRGNVSFGKGEGEVGISAEAENLKSLQPKNERTKCHQTQSLIQTRSEYIFCCISHGWL